MSFLHVWQIDDAFAKDGVGKNEKVVVSSSGGSRDSFEGLDIAERGWKNVSEIWKE